MLNNTILQGRLVREPELKKTRSEVSYCDFTVAWSEAYNEIEKEYKCFLRCKAWRGTADFLCKYFKKGQDLLVEGKLLTEEWEADGERKRHTVLLVEKIHFCGKKEATSQNVSSEQKNSNFQEVADDEGLPF